MRVTQRSATKRWVSRRARPNLRSRRLPPLHLMPRQNFAHRVDELVLGHGELRLGLLLQVVVAVLAQPRDLGAENEVLDLDFTLGFFIAALDHDARAAALVGVF